MSKQYKSRITEQQKMILLEFIESHRELVSGYLTKNFSQADKARLWNDLTEILNACVGGGLKDADSWKGCWGDLKTGVKKKLTRLKMPDDGLPPPLPLNSFEERVLSLMEGSAGYSGEKEFDEVMSCVAVETVGLQQDAVVSSGTLLKEEEQDSQIFVIPDCLTIPTVQMQTAFDKDVSSVVDLQPLHADEIVSSPLCSAPKKRSALREAEVAVGSCAAAQVKQACALQQLADTTNELLDCKRRKLILGEEKITCAERRLAAEEKCANDRQRKSDILDRKVTALERRAAAEERRVAAEERRAATEERRVAAEERRVTIEERRMVVEERKVTAEERKAAALERIEGILVGYFNK